MKIAYYAIFYLYFIARYGLRQGFNDV